MNQEMMGEADVQSEVSPIEIHSANYQDAMKYLNKGALVSRKGWNGKNMFIYKVEGTTVPRKDLRNEAAVADNTYWENADLPQNENGDKPAPQNVMINPHIDMRINDGSVVVGWAPTQVDMQATDWGIVK